MMVGSQACFVAANPDCVDVAVTLSSALMADTPYEFVLSTTSSGQQPLAGSYGPFTVRTQATKDEEFSPSYDFNGAFGYVQTGAAPVATGDGFTGQTVAYDKGTVPSTFESDDSLYSNYILVNNNVQFKFTVAGALLTKLRSMEAGYRLIPFNEEGFTIMNHAWKISGVSKSPTETVINSTLGIRYFSFPKLGAEESEFELTVQVTNPAMIATGSMKFMFIRKWDNEVLAELIIIDCFVTKTKDIEGDALKLALAWGVPVDNMDVDDDGAKLALVKWSPHKWVMVTPANCAYPAADCIPVMNQMNYTFSIPTTGSENLHITDDRIPEGTNLFLNIKAESLQKHMVGGLTHSFKTAAGTPAVCEHNTLTGSTAIECTGVKVTRATEYWVSFRLEIFDSTSAVDEDDNFKMETTVKIGSDISSALYKYTAKHIALRMTYGTKKTAFFPLMKEPRPNTA